MSICDLGRPARDAAFQNLTVNDTLRSNKLLKSGKAEIDQLCANIEELKQSNILFIGSLNMVIRTQGQTLPPNYILYNLPSGTRDIESNYPLVSSSDVSTTLYTDVDLVVQKIQATIRTDTIQSRSDVHNVDFSIYIGSTPSSLSNLVTVSILNTNGNDVRETNTSAIAIIPAGSYYSAVIHEGPGSTENTTNTLFASWTIELIPRI